jgi:hypothetical protein
MSRRPIAVLVAAALAAPVIASPAHAVRCRAVCRPAIQACIQEGGKRRACKRAYLRACRRAGTVACELTPPTTTSTTTTTSSTSTSTTTTTTLPALPNYAGTWFFYGTLSSDPCGVASGYTASGTLTIQQSGRLLTGRMGTFAFRGELTPDGFYLDTGVFSNPDYPGCYGQIRIEADGTGTRIYAGLGIGVQCSGITCVVVYEGTLTR